MCPHQHIEIALLNLIYPEPGINKIYLYAKDPKEAKYQLLLNKRESTELKILMIQKLSSNAQKIWKLFIKLLKIIIQIKNEKY